VIINQPRNPEESGEMKKLIEEAKSKLKEYNHLSMEEITRNEVVAYEIDYYLNFLQRFEEMHDEMTDL
jgi:hypothetical protein